MDLLIKFSEAFFVSELDLQKGDSVDLYDETKIGLTFY